MSAAPEGAACRRSPGSPAPGPRPVPRVAAVRVEPPADAAAERALLVALLAGGPRVVPAGAGLCRIDARGWGRRGGEEALVRTLREAATEAGFPGAAIGVADVPVAADAAAWLAGLDIVPSPPGLLSAAPGVVRVSPGAAREFLAPLPLEVLPLAGELAASLRAAGLRRVGELAAREPAELEARFGADGLRAHGLARGEDDRRFPPFDPRSPPEAALDLGRPVDTVEPLLFVLRSLLARVCEELRREGWCAERLLLALSLEGDGEVEAAVRPARPTRREDLLHDLCRAALERAAGTGGRIPAPVRGVLLRVERRAAAEARQGDLFASRWRDPMAAAVALSRLRARLGEEAVAWPAPLAAHRPERRDAWRPVEEAGERPAPARPDSRSSPGSRPVQPSAEGEAGGESAEKSPRAVLRLFERPRPVEVRCAGGRLACLRLDGEEWTVAAAEGPERLSGDWWRDPFRREYYRVCTTEGALLWLFREYRRDGELRWWLHGWWD